MRKRAHLFGMMLWPPLVGLTMLSLGATIYVRRRRWPTIYTVSCSSSRRRFRRSGNDALVHAQGKRCEELRMQRHLSRRNAARGSFCSLSGSYPLLREPRIRHHHFEGDSRAFWLIVWLDLVGLRDGAGRGLFCLCLLDIPRSAPNLSDADKKLNGAQDEVGFRVPGANAVAWTACLSQAEGASPWEACPERSRRG